MPEDTKKKKGFFDRLNKIEKVLGCIVAVATIAAAVYGFWPDGNGPELPNIKIIDAQFDSPGSDSADNLNGEWVQIKNLEGYEVDMSGWKLCDYGDRNVYHFAEFLLPSGGTVKVFSGCGDDSLSELYWRCGHHIWNNDGDTASLFTVDAVCVSEFSD
jgi:hypothetical protein